MYLRSEKQLSKQRKIIPHHKGGKAEEIPPTDFEIHLAFHLLQMGL
jgi:hypothetical protein